MEDRDISANGHGIVQPGSYEGVFGAAHILVETAAAVGRSQAALSTALRLTDVLARPMSGRCWNNALAGLMHMQDEGEAVVQVDV
eukprot:7044238-Pyramimonas_sp.AAC.1